MDDIIERKELIRNMVTMGVSMMVIAAVTIAVVAGTDNSRPGAVNLKTLLSVCSQTDNPGICYSSLKYAGERGTLLNYVKASINVTLAELKVVAMPKPELERSLTPLQALSHLDCLEFLDLGIEELESMYTKADSSEDLSNMNLDEVMNSLSAVISYQQTCSEGLLQTNAFEAFGYSLDKPILLTRIALAIVHSFSGHGVSKFRRLLTGTHLGKARDKYPTWFSAGDRKLLESQRDDGNGSHPQANVVVAQDGSGRFLNITKALDACPRNNKDPCIIYVKKGKYKERVVIPKDLNQVFMYGDGPMNTVVSGIHKTEGEQITSYRSATLVVTGKGFICKDMGFIAPIGMEGAPALFVLSDHSAFFNCKMEGEEGSLFAAAHRQFYRDCQILGSVGIIKGDSATVIQNSDIIVKHQISPHFHATRNVVTAQSRIDRHERTGFVIQNCTIKADRENTSVSLPAGTTCMGTPYREYSRTIIMESFLGEVIDPEGWCKWSDNYGTETATFREYNNRGPGATTKERVRWQGYQTVSQRDQVASFTAGQFIQADQWLQSAGIPYFSGFVPET